MYDVTRIVFIQIDEDLLLHQDEQNRDAASRASSSAMSSVQSAASKFVSAKGGEEKQYARMLAAAIDTKIVYFDEVLEGKKNDGAESQTDLGNLVQQVQIFGDKVYLWNENVFQILEIKFSIDPDE